MNSRNQLIGSHEHSYIYNNMCRLIIFSTYFIVTVFLASCAGNDVVVADKKKQFLEAAKRVERLMIGRNMVTLKYRNRIVKWFEPSSDNASTQDLKWSRVNENICTWTTEVNKECKPIIWTDFSDDRRCYRFSKANIVHVIVVSEEQLDNCSQ